jgi:uncharacterized protein
MKRILSLDGGGIRGALTLGYLQNIEDVLRKHCSDEIDPDKFRLHHYFDLIGGTSTGSIIASALAIGMSVSEIKEKYFSLGEKIFGTKYDWWKPWETSRYLKAGYSYMPLEKELKEIFDDITLGSDKILTGLCIVTKRADTNSTWLFHNNPKGKFFDSALGRNKDIPLWMAIRASTAAPTYFVPQLLNVGNEISGAFVDGGVSSANNPALELFKVATMKGFAFNWPVGEKNIFLLSLGTGNSEYFSKASDISERWLLNWAKEIPDMLMADASWGNQTILQWISRCLTPKEIDLEIGNLEDECIVEKPLLTYARYNSRITVDYLNGLGIGRFNERDVDSLKEMSNAQNCRRLFDIGEAAAKQEVDATHFPA